jgi:AbrB family looped-hinge helix DNA binding protein
MKEERSVVIATGTVLKKGGSLQITIPKEVVELLELEPGDNVMFVYDREAKRVFLDKVAILTTPSGLSFSISKELAKKLLKEEEKRK